MCLTRLPFLLTCLASYFLYEAHPVVFLVVIVESPYSLKRIKQLLVEFLLVDLS